MADPVGRNSERDLVTTFLAAAASAPAVLTIEGEAGIGKTTLCRYALAQARESGAVVLACHPTSAEESMSFAGLTDLLAEVTDEAFADLPGPQQQALAVAALREEASGSPPDERAIGTGLQTLITGISDVGAVVIVIDDAQWLDRASTAILGFALRRIAGGPVGVLVSRRSDARGGFEFDDDVFVASWRQELQLRGMSAAALFHVVRGQLGITLARPALARITESSGGNPFIALELARFDAEGPAIPETLHDVSVSRLSRLSSGAQQALLATACIPKPVTTRLAELGLAGHLDEAEAAGVVEVIGERIEFAHPLLRAAAIDLSSNPARRVMHGRLAETARDPEEIAHHRALASPGPNEAVAAALSAAAESASRRGASATAAELASLALARTEDPESLSAWTRRVRAAELIHHSGDSAAAEEVLQRLGHECPPGAVRGRGWLLLTEISYQTRSKLRAKECASLALVDADDDLDLRINALLSMAALTTNSADRIQYSAMARQCLEDSGVDEPGLLAWALCEDVVGRFHSGEGLDLQTLDRALAMERAGRTWSSADQVAAVRPVLLKWVDLHQEALDAFAELEARAVEEGNEGTMPYSLGHRSNTLLRMGRFDEAEAVAVEHLFHAEATGQHAQRIQALQNLAAVDAQAGRLDLAEGRAKEVLAWAEKEQAYWLEMTATGVLGFIALTAERADDACRWFERWRDAMVKESVIDAGVSRHHGDEIEAMIALGEIDAATDRTERLSAFAARSGRISAAALAARCRALLAASSMQGAPAVEHIEEALRLMADVDMPFEAARTYFVKGIVHRRAKEKRLAREALSEAESAFKELGAEAWAVRAGAELARVGTRTTAPLELSETERRIAELVASGLTNRQVAEQAFISPKTVEANLAKIYRKLGISSRAELGARMALLSDTR